MLKKTAKIHRDTEISDFTTFNFGSFSREKELEDKLKEKELFISKLQDKLKQIDDVNKRKLTELDVRYQEELERAKNAAFDKGYADGFKDGEDKGLQTIKPAVDFLNQTAEYIQNEIDQFFYDSEDVFLNLLAKIVSKACEIQIEENPEIVVNVVKKSIKEISDRSNVKILVSADEMNLVKSQLDDIKQHFDNLKNISVEADSRVKKGGVLLETNTGYVDGRLNVRLEEILDKLYRIKDEN
ncbi:MAG: hypothetical protein JXR48_02780 [Candidatus Delongbacteria bacterium]|nr:hypothetical protein [Candidatus Delongbacteria bacterium]MBN2833872.1 hypothetical protein [Candidatus Delongbacteria bacterium]